MRSNVQHRPVSEDMGLGPKKTFLILFTVVGCIAILFPKIFYPMIVGPSPAKDLNRVAPNLQKQERPSHLKELIHPGMQERGRAIPPHPTVPIIIERPGRPLPPNIERRPGSPLVAGQPGPNLRAAAYQAQQQQTKTGNQSIIMPIYTFGIVAFFIFTIVKMLLKKNNKNKSVPIEADTSFAEKVPRPDPKKKLVYTAIQGIIDATTQQLNEIERECAEKNKEHNVDRTGANEENRKDEEEIKLDEKEKSTDEEKEEAEEKEEKEVKENDSCDNLLKLNDEEENKESESKNESNDVKTEHDMEIEKRLNHLKEAMHIKSVENDENSDLKSIYLEGELPNDPKIFVSATETETKTEKLSHYHPSVNDAVDDDETAIILSGKMTISLISLANNNNNDEDKNKNGIVEDHTTTTNNNIA